MDPKALDDTTRQLTELALRWADAELRGDTDVLREVLADDFVGIAPRGFVLDRRDWIGRHDTHALEYSEFTWDDVQLHLHGAVAVMTGRNHAHGIQAGNAFDGRFRGMLVLVHHGKHWRIVAAQLAPIAEIPQPRREYAPM